MERHRAAFAACVAAVSILAGCVHSNGSTAQSTPRPSASGTTTPSFTDIAGTPGEKYITGLAALGVFGTPGGAFDPNGTITRADFVRWLVLANNAIFAQMPSKQIHLSPSTTSAYPDVATSHPDFPYIQGLYDAGFAVGFPDKTFRPDALLTREQMIAMKESVDRGGVGPYYVVKWASMMPDWKDTDQIGESYRGAIAEDSILDKSAVTNWNQPGMVIGNVARAFGAITTFQPQQTVTREQAAAVLWRIGPHDEDITIPTPENLPRSVAQALARPKPALKQ